MMCEVCCKESLTPLKGSGYFVYHHFNIQKFCVPPTVCFCFVWVSEQRAIISLYSTNWLFFFKPRRSVFTARYGLFTSGAPRRFGGFKPPPPKFRSFDKVEPDCKLSGKCLVFLFQHPN